MIVLEMAQRRGKRAERTHVVQYAINTVNEYERRDYKTIKLNAITPKNIDSRETRNKRAK